MAEKFSEKRVKQLNQELEKVIVEYEKALKNYDKIKGLYQQMALAQNMAITDEDMLDLAPEQYHSLNNARNKRDALTNKLKQYNSSSLKNRAGHSAKDIEKWKAEARSKSGEIIQGSDITRYKSAEASAEVFKKNINIKTWISELLAHGEAGDGKGIKETLKAAPKSLKKFTGVLGLAITAVTTSIKAVKKLVKAFDESAEKFRQVTNLSVRNNTADVKDIKRAEAIEHVNSIKASLDQLKNNIDSFVLSLAGMLKNYEEWWVNNWNNKIGKLVPALKIDPSSLDNDKAQSTGEQRDLSLNSAINSARAGGADNKTAKTLGGKSNSLISKIMNSAKDGVTYDSVADAVQKAIFSGDISGLQALGLNINDYSIKAGLYEQGFDVSGNTKYMDSALAGGRLSALEKLVDLTDAQLQEMTQQGLVLDNINQNFAWESVEALSTVNTDAGHYDKNGDFIVDGVSEALDKTAESIEKGSEKIINFYSANHNRKAVGLPDISRIIETSGTILSERKDIRTDGAGLKTLGTDGNGHGYKDKVDVTVKVECDNDLLKVQVKDVVREENYNMTNNSYTGSNNKGTNTSRYWSPLSGLGY